MKGNCVFISYSSQDTDIAFKVHSVLQSLGIPCWIAPARISPGQIWADQIVRAIRQAQIMILILSPAFTKSKHTRRELIIADAEGLEIIPLSVSETQLDDAWLYFLCERQWKKATVPPLEDRLGELAKAIELINAHGNHAGSAPSARVRALCADLLESAQEMRPRTLAPKLPVRLPTRTKGSITQPSRLIEAHNTLIPLIGRENDLRWLRQFRDADKAFQWTVLKGEGGVGKTRLSIEFCRECCDEGWHAGFVGESDLKRFLQDPHAALWEPLVPTLIVVDYAASKLKSLSALMELLVAGTGSIDSKDTAAQRPSVRLLLLERESAYNSGWLYDLRHAGEHDTRCAIQDASVEAKLLKPPVSDRNDDSYAFTREIIEATMTAWSHHSGKPRPTNLDFRPDQWRRIQTATTNRPLYLQLAAIHACEEGDARSLYHVTRTDLLRAAVDREINYARRQCQNSQLEVATNYITGLLCLTGLSVIHERNWYDCIREALADIGCRTLSEREVEMKRESVFPSTGDDSDRSAIQPDIVAAAFCWEVFRREHVGFVGCCRRALYIGGMKCWPRLIRLVQDLHGLPGYGDVAGQVQTLVGDRPYAELEELAAYLPERSLSLQGLADKLYGLLAEELRGQNGREAKLADTLVRWTYYQSVMACDHELGVRLGKEAIAVLQRLSEKDWPAFAPLLARAHHYLASNIDASQTHVRGDDHITQNECAIDIRRKLCETDREGTLFDLADSLNNESNYLSQCGRHEESLSAITEAIELADSANEITRSKNLHRLARYYNVYGERLLEQGRVEDARPLITKSVELRRELYNLDPDVHALPFTSSLWNHWRLFEKIQDAPESVRILEELLRIYDELACRVPLSHALDLVQVGVRLAHHLLRARKPEQAKDVIEETGNRLISLHAIQPSSQLAEKIVGIGMRLAEFEAEKGFRQSAISLLEHLTGLCTSCASKEAAISAVQEQMLNLMLGNTAALCTVDQWSRLGTLFLEWYSHTAGTSEQAASAGVAQVALNLGLDVWAAGDVKTALDLTTVASDIYTFLSQRDADVDFFLKRVDSLNNLSYMLMSNGDLVPAEKTAQTARKLLDEFKGFKPVRFMTVEGNLLDTLAHVLIGLGSPAEATQYVDRAVTLYRERTARPEAEQDGTEELVFGLMTKAKTEVLLQRPQEAMPHFTEALSILLKLQCQLSRVRSVVFRRETEWLAERFRQSDLELPDKLIESALGKLKD